MSVAFDVKGKRVTGNAFPVAQDVISDASGNVKGAISQSGTFIYQSGVSTTLPVLAKLGTQTQPIIPDPRNYFNPRFSPTGDRLAMAIRTGQATDIWIYDLQKGTLQRVTSEGINLRPEWSPDGKRILFRSERSNRVGIWWQPADGSGQAEPLLQNDFDPFEGVLAPDGRYLIFRTGPAARNSRDIFFVDLQGDRTPQPLVSSSFQEMMPRVSPDGKWMVYSSDESGQFEVYVRPFPNAGARIQISTAGGQEPLWSRDGRTLYYRNGSRLIAADVRTSPAFAITGRHTVLEGDFATNPSHPNYDIAPDGKQLLMLKRAGGQVETVVVHNWLAELRARAPRN